jgi:DNA-binding transcriptional MerR regulator
LTPYHGTALSLADVEALTIGRLARQAGVNIETIRFYERRGLLRVPPRTDAGYRQYSPSDLWRLQFIARAKRLGFTLAEIAGLVGTETTGSADAVRRVAQAKIRALDDRQQEIVATRARLQRLVAICEDASSEDCTALWVTG